MDNMDKEIINKVIINSNNSNSLVSREEMDDYIEDIRIRVLQGRLPPENINIVKRYEEYKNHNRVGKIDFVKLMNYLIKNS